MKEVHSEQFSPVARDHARHPRNHGSIPTSDGCARITGPCGDTMTFWIEIEQDRVKKAHFDTDGCDASVACGSAATCLVEGKSVSEAMSIQQSDVLAALGGLPDEVEHCALLAAKTLRAACGDYLTRRRGAERSLGGEERGKPAGREGTDRRAAPEDTETHGDRGGGSTCACGEREHCAESPREARENRRPADDRQVIGARLRRIRHKIVVLSGKGGVGKSTVAVNLAVGLALSGRRVGLLDVDIHGPSVPTMLGLEREAIHAIGSELSPVEAQGVKVLSLGFFLQSPDDAVIWRGPLKMNVIRQFLTEVAWGDLDYLVIDCPPGTGDEPLSVCQLIGDLDGAVIVTTPQKVAAVDVRKAITFCRQVQVSVLGVIENMSGFVCPLCGELTRIFRSGGGEEIAEDMGVPFLGAIPIDPAMVEACDGGVPFVSRYGDSATGAKIREIVRMIAGNEDTPGSMEREGGHSPRARGAESPRDPKEPKHQAQPQDQKEDQSVRIALPLANGELSLHFGHCEKFALLDVDSAAKTILKRTDVDAPPHQPGLLPAWLAERGVSVVISGGMGHRARDLFAGHGIEVVTGAAAGSPEKLVGAYLAGTLITGENICDH